MSISDKESQSKKSTSKDERVMSFLDHLEELRSRILKSLAAVGIATIICYFFAKHIIDFLTHPFPGKLIFLAPSEAFVIYMKISFFAGLLVSLPIVSYQLWQFVVPGLLDKEKKYVPVIVIISTVLFLTGALFCYYVMIPIGLKFLLSFQTEDIVATITLYEYLKFVTMLMLVFGIVFELPLLSMFLTKINILTPSFLTKYRRHAIVVNFIVAAILTPPDVISQMLLAGPLLLLYEISIIVSKIVYKSKT
jgi:sec-independent protein translocase protein TatC